MTTQTDTKTYKDFDYGSLDGDFKGICTLLDKHKALYGQLVELDKHIETMVKAYEVMRMDLLRKAMDEKGMTWCAHCRQVFDRDTVKLIYETVGALLEGKEMRSLEGEPVSRISTACIQCMRDALRHSGNKKLRGEHTYYVFLARFRIVGNPVGFVSRMWDDGDFDFEFNSEQWRLVQDPHARDTAPPQVYLDSEECQQLFNIPPKLSFSNINYMRGEIRVNNAPFEL